LKSLSLLIDFPTSPLSLSIVVISFGEIGSTKHPFNPLQKQLQPSIIISCQQRKFINKLSYFFLPHDAKFSVLSNECKQQFVDIDNLSAFQTANANIQDLRKTVYLNFCLYEIQMHEFWVVLSEEDIQFSRGVDSRL